MNTPDSTLPPIDPTVPRRKMVITIEVAENFEKRLDNQWMVEREINADRWSWQWADEAAKVRSHVDEGLESDSIVASCNCLTKTGEVKYHKPGCKYRLICERDSARAEVAELQRELPKQNAADCASFHGLAKHMSIEVEQLYDPTKHPWHQCLFGAVRTLAEQARTIEQLKKENDNLSKETEQQAIALGEATRGLDWQLDNGHSTKFNALLTQLAAANRELEGVRKDSDGFKHHMACYESKALVLHNNCETFRGILVMLKRELDSHTTNPDKLELPKTAWDEAMKRAIAL